MLYRMLYNELFHKKKIDRESDGKRTEANTKEIYKVIFYPENYAWK